MIDTLDGAPHHAAEAKVDLESNKRERDRLVAIMKRKLAERAAGVPHPVFLERHAAELDEAWARISRLIPPELSSSAVTHLSAIKDDATPGDSTRCP